MVVPSIPTSKQWLSEHHIWLDPTIEGRQKLLVFLPGQTNATPNTPAQFKYVGREAARLGYHVVVLAYPNTVGVAVGPGAGAASACKSPSYDEAAELCQENVRLEILDGTARGGTPAAPVHVVFAGMSDAQAERHSVYHRLSKVLEHLDGTRPGEAWSQFLAKHEGSGAPAPARVVWKKIVIA